MPGGSTRRPRGPCGSARPRRRAVRRLARRSGHGGRRQPGTERGWPTGSAPRSTCRRRGGPCSRFPDPEGARRHALEQAGCRVAGRAGLVRLAFHLWNDDDDADRAIAALTAGADAARCAAAGSWAGARGVRAPVSWARRDQAGERGELSVTVRVAVLGCGVVGTEVVRLLTTQADDLAARVGAPAGAGRGRRALARGAARPGGRPGPADHRRPGTGGPGRRCHRADGRPRAGAFPPAAGDRARRGRRHREQGAARSRRPDVVRGGRRCGRRPVLRGGGGRRDPAGAPGTRVARRGRGDPRARHRQRHHQLRARPDGHDGCRPGPGRQAAPRSSATPRPTRRPTSRVTTRPRRPRSSPRSPSTRA